jgi:hypothetical protein
MKWMHGVRARLGLLRRGVAEARMEEEMKGAGRGRWRS